MKPINEHIVYKTLRQIIVEQEEPETPTEDDTDSTFSPDEQKFLGKFDTYNAKQLGVIYSITDIGIREFLARSGTQLECNAGILFQLLRDKIIKIVPSGGYGSDTDYTIELQLSLSSVKGMGGEPPGAGGTEAAAGGDMAVGAEPPGAPPVGAEPPGAPPEIEGPPMESVINFKDIINESVKIAKQLILEKKDKKKRPKDIDLHINTSRILQRVPREFLYQLKRVISQMDQKSKNRLDQERLIADILDVLQLNFNLTDFQIRRSYEFHKNQKRLQKFLEK